MLPPPPPDMCISNSNVSSHYHVSPVTSPAGMCSKPFPVLPPTNVLPPTAPKPVNMTPVNNSSKPIQNSAVSTLKKTGTLPKSSRRISFDDHVQMIEAPRSTPEPPPPLPEPSQPSEPILKYSPQPPIRNNPKKLSANENYNSLPRTFLDNLQKVMSKKWQVAEKCRQNESSPYEVLGFRDETMNTSPGQNNLYNKNSAIGAWVLETQMYSAQ